MCAVPSWGVGRAGDAVPRLMFRVNSDSGQRAWVKGVTSEAVFMGHLSAQAYGPMSGLRDLHQLHVGGSSAVWPRSPAWLAWRQQPHRAAAPCHASSRSRAAMGLNESHSWGRSVHPLAVLRMLHCPWWRPDLILRLPCCLSHRLVSRAVLTARAEARTLVRECVCASTRAVCWCAQVGV